MKTKAGDSMHVRVATLLLVLFSISSSVQQVSAMIPSHGKCVLDTFVPFTSRLDEHEGPFRDELAFLSSSLLTSTQDYSLGFFHMAAALLAMEDFNNRNEQVVPALRQLTHNCTVQFDTTNSQFFDTSALAHSASTSLMDQIKHANGDDNTFPCALAGPYFDVAAQNMAVLAAAAKIPHVPHRGYNYRLSDSLYSPYTSMVFPDLVVLSRSIGYYLKHIQRTNYVAVLHTQTSDLGVQRGEAIGLGLETAGDIKVWEAFSFATPGWHLSPPNRQPRHVLARIKERGFRTIVVSMEVFYLELPAIADAAEALQLNTAEYLWVFTPTFEMEAIYNLQQLSDQQLNNLGLQSYGNVTKLLSGSALVQPVEPYQYLKGNDPFWNHWKNQNKSLVERLNRLYQNNTQYYADKPMDQPAEEDFFQTQRPQAGTAFLYDAVQAIGIGACAAQRQVGAGNDVEGALHLNGIHHAEFHGATGAVKLDVEQMRYTRSPPSATAGVFNMYPPTTESSDVDSMSLDEAFVLTEILQGIPGARRPPNYKKTGKRSSLNWTPVGPQFVYASGETTPPLLLRDIPEQNYLSENLQKAGLALMAVALILCGGSIVWIGCHWNSRVVKASQPYFLSLVLFGAMVAASAIFTISWDESYGWTQDQLSKACMAAPWLFSIGFVISYGAMFTKLLRIHKVLQFRRRKVSANHVAGPMVVIYALALIILTVWTIASPMSWEREVVDDITGESRGQCSFGQNRVYVALMGTLKVVSALLTSVMAYKTRDIADIYSESSYMFTLIVLQLQILVIGVPIGVILYDTSTDGWYMGLTMMFWSFPITVFGLIMMPKMIMHYRGDLGPNVKAKRGGSRGVQVSGVSEAAVSYDTNPSLHLTQLAQGSSNLHTATGTATFNKSSVMDIFFNESRKCQNDEADESTEEEAPKEQKSSTHEGDSSPSFHDDHQ